MKNLICLALLSLIVACGNSSNNDPRLEGEYVIEVDGACVLALAFKGEQYVIQYGCHLEDGSLGVEVEHGEFTFDKNYVYFTPMRSTCPNDDGHPYDVQYAFNGDYLNVTFGSQSLRLEKVEPRPEEYANVATLGCYEDDGFFYPHPLSHI